MRAVPESLVARVRRAVEASGPLCVGIDPSAAVVAAWGRRDGARGVEYVARTLLASCAPFASALKVQVAFFERLGAAGFAALEATLREARDTGALVIADAKRGDIGSSNEGYAQAWLEDGAPLAVDALTVSPYLGVAALQPLIERAALTGRGVFVLARTSNPEGRGIQEARTISGAAVADEVVARVRELNAGVAAGATGIVLGATAPAPAAGLNGLGGAILVPGVGAQGGTEQDVRRLTQGAERSSVLVSVSRALTDSGPDARGLATAARAWRERLAQTLT